MKNKAIPAHEISEMITGLNRMARNLWWTWNQEAQEFFQELSPRGWQNLYHNGVAILHEVSEYELRTRLQDHEFAAHARRVLLGHPCAAHGFTRLRALHFTHSFDELLEVLPKHLPVPVLDQTADFSRQHKSGK